MENSETKDLLNKSLYRKTIIFNSVFFGILTLGFIFLSVIVLTNIFSRESIINFYQKHLHYQVIASDNLNGQYAYGAIVIYGLLAILPLYLVFLGAYLNTFKNKNLLRYVSLGLGIVGMLGFTFLIVNFHINVSRQFQYLFTSEKSFFIRFVENVGYNYLFKAFPYVIAIPVLIFALVAFLMNITAEKEEHRKHAFTYGTIILVVYFLLMYLLISHILAFCIILLIAIFSPLLAIIYYASLPHVYVVNNN